MTKTFAELPLTAILPNPDQPRKHFSVADLESLADSIKEHGVLNPISVRGPYEEGSAMIYILIDGERRVRASKLAGKTTIPAYICENEAEDSHQNNLELALIGNLQREDMNPVDEGGAYLRLHKTFHYTLARISRSTGKSMATINSRMKIMELEPEIQNCISNGSLPYEYQVIAAILSLPDDIRIDVVTKLARRNVGAQTIKATITRITNNRGLPVDRKKRKASSPAASYSEAPKNHIFETLAARGVTPQWAVIEAAAKETCINCTLYEGASDQICRECPAVEMVKRIVKLVNTEVSMT
jgi:ParB family chromosome partitioning protein